MPEEKQETAAERAERLERENAALESKLRKATGRPPNSVSSVEMSEDRGKKPYDPAEDDKREESDVLKRRREEARKKYEKKGGGK